MMLSTAPTNMIFKARNMSDLKCMVCSKPMTLYAICPVSNQHQIRSCDCAKCDAVEEFVVEL